MEFPYGTLSPGTTEKLAAAAARKDAGLRVTNLTIRPGIVDGDLAWSVVTESDERPGVMLRARPRDL